MIALFVLEAKTKGRFNSFRHLGVLDLKIIKIKHIDVKSYQELHTKLQIKDVLIAI